MVSEYLWEPTITKGAAREELLHSSFFAHELETQVCSFWPCQLISERLPYLNVTNGGLLGILEGEKSTKREMSYFKTPKH